jgi:hypothetical protein
LGGSTHALRNAPPNAAAQTSRKLAMYGHKEWSLECQRLSLRLVISDTSGRRDADDQ